VRRRNGSKGRRRWQWECKHNGELKCRKIRKRSHVVRQLVGAEFAHVTCEQRGPARSLRAEEANETEEATRAWNDQSPSIDEC